MKRRYRFHACPKDDCPKLGSRRSRCPTHDVEMVEVILRREDGTDQAMRTKHQADRVAESARKVREASGRGDLFGDLFRGFFSP